MNLQIVLKLKRKLFLKNSLKIGGQNYLFRCYLIFVLTCNFVSHRHLLLLHTEKHTYEIQWSILSPISRRWYPVYDLFLALANALGVNNGVVIIEGTVPLLEGDGKSMNSYHYWIIKKYHEVAPRSLWLVLLVSFQWVQQGTRSP